ncbi:small GTP-binding protein, putative [Trichomonas vaginalis G3]|uniref:Small GTP-binding protein, putative n=1 Tax=Trichomonas vaginalis (strain ATCC PRA-98 / G3) TaxID=412133 RepID=A2ES63_TRIV3|nr:GTPase protein [Trichomonas vaginalis G3]EAY04500.1 small GTP-binding protein, putative [Trichomonas vaginalis G3]KAI5503275.1 GTPase protein [Trichomonas vaginalis G3]|eukprot:XP_001316723.1 small GTP-binding protein [Trichomonas vaginalis G3]
MSSADNIPIKIVLLGQSSVGKTCIASRFVKSSFLPNAVPTVGASYLTKTISFEKQVYELNIWDTAGQELYRSLTPMYYRNCHAAIVVFDITNRQSFASASDWISEVRATGEKPLLVLVGNKIDLNQNRQVNDTDGQELADQLECLYIETSALSGIGIELLFQNIIKGLNENPTLKSRLVSYSKSGQLPDDFQEEKKSCC